MLVIKDTEIWIDTLRYEYFNPVEKSKDTYRKILQKKFPFDFEDVSYNLFSHRSNNLHVLENDAEAQKMVSDAKYEAARDAPFFKMIQGKGLKELYYEKLRKMRYDNGLDKEIIPNISYLYDMEARPSETSEFPNIGRIVGGIFNLEFESTDDKDDFCYHWLLSGEMKNGEMLFYKGQRIEPFFKIQFWDCYCVEVGEKMDATYDTPMKMQIRLSPAITENRGLKHEKTWKVTDLVSKPFKPEPQAPPTPLVKSVKGEETAVPDTELEYKVTDYNINVSKADKDRIQWKVKVGKEESLLPEKGEVIKLKIKQEWAGKEILVMPYLKTPTERVSVKTKVEECPYVNTLKIANYICIEIKTNYLSPVALKIKQYNYDFLWGSPFKIIDNKLSAYGLWADIVGRKKDWDHKAKVRDLLGYKIDNPKEKNEWSCDKNKSNPLLFNFDIWSNIHYGFIGKYVGFTEFELLNGAGYAQVADNSIDLKKWETWKEYLKNRVIDFGDGDMLGGFDDPMDQQSIKIGFNLYDQFKDNPILLTSTAIMNELYQVYKNQKPINIIKCDTH